MSYRYDGNCPVGCKVYIGGLARTASKEEIELAFERYGKLANVFVARNPPGFAFVEFTDPQDAEDSVRALDGRSICGSRVKVEISHGRSKNRGGDSRGRYDRRGGGDSYDRRGGGDSYDRRGGGDNYDRRDRRGEDRRVRSRTPEKRTYSDASRSRSRSNSKGRKGQKDRFSERSPPKYKSTRTRSRSRSRS